jgi:soluble lytic murein transglycosylase
MNDNSIMPKHKWLSTRALVFLFSLICSPLICAQSPSERHERIRALVDRGDNRAALAELQSLRTAQPAIFTQNNYDYLLARLAEQSGDLAQATIHFQVVVTRNSPLKQYALWHLSRLARTSGNLPLEREKLRELLTTTATSLLREAAAARLGESFFESGDYAAAIQTLRPRSSAGGTASAREAQTLIGQAYLRSGQKEAAREAFSSLVARLPNPSQPDDFALAGVRGLDALDAGSEEAARKAAPQLPLEEHLRRAHVYYFNRDFAGSRLHYLAIVERYGQSPSVPEALFLMGRGFSQERNFEEAFKYFQRVVNEFPSSGQARDALNYSASALSRLNRVDEAIAAYKTVIDRYPGGSIPERPFLNIVDLLRDAGRDQEALTWIEQTRTRFKGQVGATLALFSKARLHLSQGAWEAALSDFNALRNEANLGGAQTSGSTNKTEVAFTRAFLLEQLGRTEEAINGYLEIPDGRNEYYGWRATHRLRSLSATEKTRPSALARLEALRSEARKALDGNQFENARRAAQAALRLTEEPALTKELLDIARRAYSQLPDYNNIPTGRLLPAGRQTVITREQTFSETAPTNQALADELLFLGLYDEGAPELAAAQKASTKADTPGEPKPAQDSTEAGKVSPPQTNEQKSPPSSPARSQDSAYTLAVLYKRGGNANHAVRYAEPLWKRVPGDYLLELAPRDSVELLYPAPYIDSLLEYAPPRGVDPRFVLSIMRQESRFRPEAKSVAAARGLLQFIPSTADSMAAQLALRDFKQDDLYNPRIAVLFGSQYMGNLFKQFPNMPQAVAASYNGGEDNVARWTARARSDDPDRYVLEIGFAQSKDYIYKVLANYRVYQTLYTEQLQRR